jgi:outer membrane protein OmpA-like peptidoglycan-associated protein
MSKHNNDSHWISLSDMMTGLMLVFLLIAVLFMQQYQEDVVAYENTQQELYDELDAKFSDKYEDWQMVLGEDLSIKFTNPEVLFSYRSSEISSRFEKILEDFIPMYLEILTDSKYEGMISEVRIEGHTGDWDEYMYTIELSQDRANAVLRSILNSDYYRLLSDKNKELVKFWMTSNGLGNGRAIDDSGDYVFNTKKEISADSRRVEFRIITRSEELIEKIINKK